MQLLNVHTLTLRKFRPANLPKYAITSHRWVEDEEASAKDIRKGLGLIKSGHCKVQGFAEYVKNNINGIDWLWIDTCCINQDSSQEVSEAINSMFKWYLNAEVCIAYLPDVPNAGAIEAFPESSWFKRGWTLQELLAPRIVLFLAHDWNVIGHKGDAISASGSLMLQPGPCLTSRISAITRIPEPVLNDYKQSRGINAEEKLRWLAGRQTSVDEDLTYCLLGIFGVTMSIIYGEGHDRARRRLMRKVVGRRQRVNDTNLSRHCVSVPYSTVSTYTERPSLSEELEHKMRKAYGSSALAHAVAVVGLGGTGKTQLVLHYIDKHLEEYDTVLWLDARNEETTRASFQRCCRALSLPFESAPTHGEAKNAPEVQALLHWLLPRQRDQEWLVIVDNADDLSWNLAELIPHGPAGSVIVTSQDSHAARILGGRCNIVKVDTMSPQEAASLLYKHVDQTSEDSNNIRRHRRLAEQIVIRLDNLPLAIDLAGARIGTDVEDGDDLTVSMARYVADLQRHKDHLLENEQYARSSSYNQTIWTVWETTLLSIKSLETESPDTRPLQLLQLLSMLNRTSIQDELFRLAALGLEQTSRRLSIDAPRWLKNILSLGEDGKWDEFHYRAALRPLLRYGLVRATTASWSGITMHSLVQWRISREGYSTEVWDMFVLLITSACVQQWVEPFVHFRRYLVVHLPSLDRLQEWRTRDQTAGLGWSCFTIGRIWGKEGRHNASEEMLVTAFEEYMRVLGEQHAETLDVMSHLASSYSHQRRFTESEELELKVVDISARTRGKEHSRTLLAMDNLAMTYSDQGRLNEAEELELIVLEATARTRGIGNHRTILAIDNLAYTYLKQGRLKESRELWLRVIEAWSKTLGSEHPETLLAIHNLATAYRMDERLQEAEDLFLKVVSGRSKILGEEHPDTVAGISNLALVYWERGRYEDALQLQNRIVNSEAGALGLEHPKTLSSIEEFETMRRTRDEILARSTHGPFLALTEGKRGLAVLDAVERCVERTCPRKSREWWRRLRERFP